MLNECYLYQDVADLLMDSTN